MAHYDIWQLISHFTQFSETADGAVLAVISVFRPSVSTSFSSMCCSSYTDLTKCTDCAGNDFFGLTNMSHVKAG